MKNNSTSIISRLLIICILTFSMSEFGYSQVQFSGTVNSGTAASAINFETQATGNYSLATGYQSIASGLSSTAIGYKTNAAGTRSFSLGENCYSSDQGYSFGQGAKANVSQSLAIGRFVETNASGSIVLGSSISGYSLINNKTNSLMIGFNSTIPTLFVSESEAAPFLNGVGKVGIGTSSPIARLQIADGDIFIQDINKGIVMKSPDGNCWRGTLNNSGQLEFVQLQDCESLVTKINEPEEKADIKVYPNPASKYIDIICSSEESQNYQRITLNSIDGKMILTLPLTSTSTRLSIENIDSGSYVIIVSGKSNSYSEKILIN